MSGLSLFGLYIILLLIISRRDPQLFFKRAKEMYIAGITGHLLYLGDGIALLKKSLCPRHLLKRDVITDGSMGVTFKQFSNIVGVQTAVFCQVIHGYIYI